MSRRVITQSLLSRVATLGTFAVAAAFAATVVTTGAAGCATTPEKPKLSADAPPAAAPLAAKAIAVRTSDSPGYNIGDLTASLRDAVARTSGVAAVDEISVKHELAACVEMPCATVMQDQFKDAEIVVTSAVSRVGDVFLARVEATRGIQALVRVNATSSDARKALEDAGWKAGAALREKLIAQGTTALGAASSSPAIDGGIAPPAPSNGPETAP